MTRPWQTLATVVTREGPLQLRRRGSDEFLILISGRVLMTSSARRSEEALATLGCQSLSGRRAPRVLVGGLGMGYTLRAALDMLPADAQVVVAELSAEVVAWCRTELAALSQSAIADARVTVQVRDVARVIAQAPAGSYDAILLDLYEGPHAATQKPSDPFYGSAALARTCAALRPSGTLAVWSEEVDAPFHARFRAAGFDVTVHRAGRGGRNHVVYLGKSPVASPVRTEPRAKMGAGSRAPHRMRAST